MKRIVLAFVLALVAVLALPQPAAATDMLIVSTSIPNWRGPTSTSMAPTVWLEIYVDQPFTDPTTGITIQSGAPESGVWYKRYVCTTATAVDSDTSETITYLVVPAVKLVATTNTTIGTKDARYSAYIVDNTGRRIPYEGFTSFRLPASFGTAVPTTGTWTIVRSFNSGPFRPQYDLSYFSREETLRLIAAGISTSGGLGTLNGLNGSSQTFTDDTNVAIVSGGTSHVITWLSQLPPARGGSGLASATANGVLYGSGTSPFGVTAQGAANSILVANAGAPSFSQTPTINTSVTIGVASSQTGSIVLRNSTNANTVTVQPGITSSSWSFTLPTTAGSSGGLLTTNGSGASTWTLTPSVTTVTTTDLTVTGLTTGRIPYVGASDQILDDSNFLWDATNDRLSIGTTLSAQAIQIGNATYYGSANAAGSATVRLIGLDSSNEVALAPSGTRVNMVGEFFNHATPTTDYTAGSEEFDYLAPASIPPFSFAHGVAADFVSNTPGNNWALVGAATAAGTRPTVGVVGLANASGAAATQTFGGNFIAGVPTTGTAAGTAQGVEVNVVNLGNNPNVGLTGMSIQNVGGTAYGTVLGTFGAYLQFGISSGGSIDHRAAARNGIVFEASALQPLLTGTEAAGIGSTSALLTVSGTMTPTFAFDLRTVTPTAAGIALAANSSISANNYDVNNLLTLLTNEAAGSGSNYLVLGTSSYSATGLTGIILRPGSTEAVRITNGGATATLGNIGLNQSSPVAQVHMTTSTKRVLTGDAHTVVNGSTRVIGTNTLYSSQLAPGSTFTVDNATWYTVRRVVSDTILYLTAAYGGTSAAPTTAYSDYAALLVENRQTGGGDDWLSVGQLPRLLVRGDSVFGDARGTFAIQSREQPNQYLTAGIHATALTGTVTMTNGSTAVTGAGTLFWGADGIASADDEIAAYQYVYIDTPSTGQSKLYQVASVASATALTLVEPYQSATAAGLTMWEGGYSYLSSLEVNTGWRPLILQGGASNSDAGGVLIGTTGISTIGAMLKVEGGGPKTSNNVGSEFNNVSTSSSSYQKIGALYIASGAWTGPSIANYAIAIGAVEGTGGNRSNVPYAGLGGKSIFAPHSSQVVTPSPYSTLLPTATVDIYGYATEVISIGADTVQTTAPGLMTGTGTTWNTVGATDRLRPGDAVMFSSDTEVYEVGSLTSDTVMNTTAVYNGTPSGSVEAYRDPYLLRLRNSFGTERFRVESSGFTKVNGTFVQRKGTDLASAASLVLGSGNVFVVTGNTTITNIYTFSGLAADSSEAGRTIVLIWGPAVGDTFDITDGGNLKLNANVTTWDSDDTITLVYDGTNWFELYRQAN